MLTSGSSAEGFRYNVDNHDPARWWCLAGRVEGNVNVGGGYNGKRVCGRQDGYMGNVDICGNVFFRVNRDFVGADK
jgi:hypothetical protein